jgi:LysM repeat protein
MTTPIAAEAVTGKASGARLVKLDKQLQETKTTVTFCFNPTEYQIQKTNSFADIPIPGLTAAPLQFIRGAGEKLAFELLLDTTQKVEDVRDVYVKPLRALMDIEPDLHGPPVLRFYWSDQVFEGVMESLNVTYTLFDKKGVPMRAKASVSLKQYLPAEVQVRETPRQSPDVDKAYRVQAGDTLSDIAAAAYGAPAAWREIARANGLVDPRRLEPGLLLRIPRIRGGIA